MPRIPGSPAGRVTLVPPSRSEKPVGTFENVRSYVSAAGPRFRIVARVVGIGLAREHVLLERDRMVLIGRQHRRTAGKTASTLAALLVRRGPERIAAECEHEVAVVT